MTDLWEASAEGASSAGHLPMMPSDLDAERILAASVMARPELTDELAEAFDPADFSEARYAWVWHAVVEIRITLTSGEIPWVAVDRQLRKWRSEGYLPVVPLTQTELALLYHDAVPGSAGWFADRIATAAAAARLVALGHRAQQAGNSPAFDPEADLAAVQSDLDSVLRGASTSTPGLIGNLIPDAIDRAQTPPTTTDRVPTGLIDLDALTGGGFAPGRLIIVGARPGVGKTTLGTGFARAAAITNRLPVLFTSLEMSRDEITNGILSAEAKIPLHHIVNGQADDTQLGRLAQIGIGISPAPLFIDDATSVSLASLRGQVRHLVRTAGLRMLVVDYLQLMQAPRAENRQVAVAALSRGLKLMAKEFGIVVVVLCQLNRASEQRSDKRPTIADLRESGAIEQDADMVILLHRPDMHDPESPRAGEADVIVDKHRGGPRATITAGWQGHYARLVDMAVM
ncbi:DnaB-like helicase C-terminal domain-containing protein [Streptomyces sp. NPDC051173]|uniref:DnaB-like helicase C-terminal domain-containing protein n=1 Tax=Streptomyces sp. NPDC051173 TaxID=3155164 RepID=UPI00344BB7EA